MPLINLPDGSQLDIPDDASPEQLTAVRAKLQGMKQQKPAGFLESLGRDVATGFGNAASGIARGAQMAAGAFLPPDVKAEQSGPPTNAQSNPLARMIGGAADSADNYWKEVAGKSTNNPYVKAGAQGVGGVLAGGQVTPTTVASGVTGSLAGEAATQMDPKNPLAIGTAQVLGSLVGGTGAALATRLRPQTASVAREAMEGISEAEMKAAQAYQAQMSAKGTDLDLAQAVKAVTGRETNLTSIRNYVAGRSQGNATQEMLRNQPGQIGREGQLVVENLPGQNWSPTQNANNLQQTATERLKQEMAARKAAVDSLYEKAGALPEGASDELIALIRRDMAKPGMTTLAKERANTMIRQLSGEDTGAAKAVEAARKELDAATSVTGRIAAREKLAAANEAFSAAAGAPLQAKDVSTWIGELRGPYQGGMSLKQTHPKEQGQLKGLAGQINEVLADMSPEIRQANATFKNFTETRINPLKQSPIGTVNQASGYNPETQAMVTKFDGLMNSGTDPNAKVSDIRTLVKEMGKVDPAAVESSFKGWVSRKFASAMDSPIEAGAASANPDIAKRTYDAFFKPAAQWQGVVDAIAEMAKLRGQRPEEVIRGLENYKKLVFAASSQPPVKGGISAADIQAQGGNSQLANAVRVFSFLPFNRAGEAIERAALGKTLREFDEILTSPQGADMLIKLGKVPVMSQKAQVILGTWGGAMSNSGGLSSDNTGY